MPELSGFRGAPVTLLLTYTVLGGSFLTNVAGPKLGAALALTSPAQVFAARPEVWRLLTSSLLLCDDFGAALVASFLLYRLRLFERQMGSSKFAAVVCLGTAVAALARAAFLAAPGLGARGVAAGPFQVVMGLLPLYYCALGLHPARPRPSRLLLPPRLGSHPPPPIPPPRAFQGACPACTTSTFASAAWPLRTNPSSTWCLWCLRAPVACARCGRR